MPAFGNYVPPKDEDFNNFVTNFDTLITAAPTDYGLVAGQATAFHTLANAFSAALVLAVNAATRTKGTVAAKNGARALCEKQVRFLAAIVQATPTVTDEQRAALGLTVRAQTRTPIGAPTTAPIVTPITTNGQRVIIRMADSETPASRSRPAGAIGMLLYVKAGDEPASIDQMSFYGMISKNTDGPGTAGVAINFAPGDVGKQAWFIGVWQNRRGQVGPQSAKSQMTIAA